MKKNFDLDGLDVKGKTVFLRCSFDVPLDSSKNLLDPKRVRDDSKIRDAVPTLKYLIENNARIILSAGWLGRPKGDDPDFSVAPAALRLQEILKENGLLKHKVLLTPNCLDGSSPRSVYKNREEVIKDVKELKESQVIILENVRYDPEANANNQEFAKFIASLAGKNAVYVNEAETQNHRPEATIASVPHYIIENGGKAVFGFKCAEVIKYIGNISKLLEKKNRGSFIFFLAGKKIETQVGITSKITVTHSLLDKMKKNDVIMVQGAVTYTFLVGKEFLKKIEKKLDEADRIIEEFNKKQPEQNEQTQMEKSEKLKELMGISDEQIKKLIGNSFAEWKEVGEQLIFASKVLLKARDMSVKILLSADHTITNNYPDKFGNLPKGSELKFFNAPVGIPNGWLGIAPGPKTLDNICDEMKRAYLVILAGPLSIEDEIVEEFSKTNKRLLAAIGEAKNNGAVTIGAGGDTAAMINRYKGENSFTIVSNAGGATLELIEKDGKLPGIVAVEESYEDRK